jgi:hypothetical protein
MYILTASHLQESCIIQLSLALTNCAAEWACCGATCHQTHRMYPGGVCSSQKHSPHWETFSWQNSSCTLRMMQLHRGDSLLLLCTI